MATNASKLSVSEQGTWNPTDLPCRLVLNESGRVLVGRIGAQRRRTIRKWLTELRWGKISTKLGGADTRR